MANFFFLTTLFSLSGMLLCQTRLLLGFTRHYIDFGYCDSVIFIFFGWFMSKQSRYINILNSLKQKR